MEHIKPIIKRVFSSELVALMLKEYGISLTKPPDQYTPQDFAEDPNFGPIVRLEPTEGSE